MDKNDNLIDRLDCRKMYILSGPDIFAKINIGPIQIICMAGPDFDISGPDKFISLFLVIYLVQINNWAR